MTAKPLPSTPPLLISERETARLLGISPRSVFTLAAGGKLPYVKIGRLKKFAVADINAFIAREKIGGDS
jgi:excisionase family DNA binding protein